MSNKTIDFTARKIGAETDKKDSRFLNLEMYAIAEGMTRNECGFTLESMEKALSSFYNMPVLAYYNPVKKDAEEHNSDIMFDWETMAVKEDYTGDKAERACGLIRESDEVSIKSFNGKKWIYFSCALWSKYNDQLCHLLISEQRKKVSVEIEVVSSHEDDNGMEIIDEFIFTGVTILGNHIEEGIEGAHLSVKDTVNEDFRKKLCYTFNAKGETFKAEKAEKKGPRIKISLSKKSASDDEWGSVNKTKLRNTLLKAENSEELIKACYLYVGPDYKDAPSENLKYPVCQIKGGQLVYNIKGVESASSFLMKNEGESYFKSVLSKLNRIRKKLGLDPVGKRKKEVKRMKYSENEIICTYDNFKLFVSDSESGEEKLYIAEECEDGEEKVYSIQPMFRDEDSPKVSGDGSNRDDEDVDEGEEDEEGGSIKDHDDKDDIEEDEEYSFMDLMNLGGVMKAMKSELEAKEEKIREMEKERREMAKEKEELEAEKCKQMAERIIAKHNIIEKAEKDEVIKMACDKKMAEEDIVKDIVYKHYKAEQEKLAKDKEMAKEEEDKKEEMAKHQFSFSLDSNTNSKKSGDVFSRLDKIK